MRQLADAAGISNPYLSQIERGLREPSADVLDAIAESLATTSDALSTEAGYVEPGPDAAPETISLLDAIKTAEELTPRTAPRPPRGLPRFCRRESCAPATARRGTGGSARMVRRPGVRRRARRRPARPLRARRPAAHDLAVVQACLSRPDSAVTRPPLWLAGFAAIDATPGEQVELDVVLARRALEHWDPAARRWVVEPGGFTLRGGASAADLPLTIGVSVTG